IEDVDDAGKRARQPLEIALERRAVLRGDVASAELPSAEALVLLLQSWAGEVGLDAAQPPAVATRQRQIVGAGERQGVVPPFAGDGVAADEHLALDDDAGADARAEDDAKDHPGSSCRAVHR